MVNAGYALGTDVTLAWDCAASEFYVDGHYDLAGEGKRYDSEAFVGYLASLCESFPIVSRKTAWMNRTGMAGKH